MMPKICRRRGAPGTDFRAWFTLASTFYQVIRLSKAGEERAAVCGIGTKSGDVWELSGRTWSMPVSKLKLYVSLRLSMAFSLSSHCLPFRVSVSKYPVYKDTRHLRRTLMTSF